MAIDPLYRRAALIATAVTVPLLVLAAVIIIVVSDSSSGPPGALEVATPPHYEMQAANCTKVIENLPIDLGKLTPRIVHTTPESPAVIAWGNPAVIFRCGVDRPKDLQPGSSTDFIQGGREAGPFYDVTSSNGDNVWTTVDRAVYISVSIPSQYQGSDIMPPLSQAIGSALPAVCVAGEASGVQTSQLCAERH